MRPNEMQRVKPLAKKVTPRELPGSKLIAKLAHDREKTKARDMVDTLEDRFAVMDVMADYDSPPAELPPKRGRGRPRTKK